ncbi:MAG: Holliday junction resolvase RuvX [Burkholderiaceae bacterium]|nr:Holliday junction resolvase RuvX [Burkholderiaceae bacterium]
MREAARFPSRPLPAPAAPQSFLAFDYGLVRTGVASGQRLLGQARPLQTITAPGDARFAPIARLIAEWQPDALVVGVPRHPDGAEHENTRRARRFARQLQGRFHLPVFEVDERYSTVEVEAGGARRADVDAAAAALILEQYFRESEAATRAAAASSPPEETP